MFSGSPQWWEAGQRPVNKAEQKELRSLTAIFAVHPFLSSIACLQSSQQSMFSSSKFQLLSVPFARLRDSVEEEVRKEQMRPSISFQQGSMVSYLH